MEKKALFVSILIICFSMVVSSRLHAQKEDDWSVTIGLGALYQPVSPGVDEYETQVIPYVDLEYGNFFLNFQEGLGVEFLELDGDIEWEFSAAIGYDFGRDASDSHLLRGLGDVDSSAEARFVVEAELEQFEVTLMLSHAIGSNGHEGFTADLSVTYDHYFEGGIFTSFGPFIRFADADYMEAYYGVSASQSEASGYSLYKPDGGLEKFGFSVLAGYQIDEHWSVIGLLTIDHLLEEADDSPFVTEETQAGLLTAVVYRF